MARKLVQLVAYAVFFGVILAIFVSSVFPAFFSRLTHPCTPAPRPVVKSTAEFDQGWTICAGLSSTIRGMLIDRNNLILGDYTRNALVAFDLKSGEIRWQTPIQVGMVITLDKIRQRIYTNALDSSIYAVNTNTGDILWRNDDYVGKHDGDEPLLLAEGQLIGRNVFAAPPRPINADTGVLGTPIAAVSTNIFPDGYAWIVQNGYLTAINALSGEIVWQTVEPNISDDRCLNDVQVNQTTVLAKICNQLVVYDFETHGIRWVQHIESIVGFASLTDENVYVLDATPTLQILRLSDGISTGEIQFEAPAAGHDWTGYGGDQIGGSQIVASGKQVAVYFADQSTLSVYRFH